MDPREVAIQSAIADLNSGVFTSQRQAAKAYSVPRSTIQERLSGRQPNAIAHHQQQRLTPEQEQFLVNWILEEDSRAQPPSHPRVREMATLILHMNGDYEPLGHKWVTHFITRNPRVASIVGRKIESARTTAANYETIRAFLELFERTRIELGIQYEDIWNMDETGVGLGVCSNSRVVASSSKKKAYVKSPEDREWVSIIESISAVGKKLQCLVIFKGKHLQSTWFLAQGSKVYLLYLPPHASHVLQPLDLAPFSVLKSRYRSGIRALSALDDAAPIKKERFVTSYNKARDKGLSERVIRAGWKAAGLCPYNPDLVLLSSQVSGRPITPPPSTQASDDVFATPQSSQALYKAQQLILSESHSRSTRLMLGKAGKAIARANTRAARLEFENQRLKYQLDSATITHSRKRVQVNPNERYSNVEAIKAAIDRAAALQAEQASRQGEDEAKKAAAAAAALTLQSMCTEWQL
ncbi:uncharacterized protein EKO05_0000813 [Ascochyta rabiei]|uniref:uncharacterized protein n=1 Tax=Didymella rabiei TaxID=5454 RepID=UPI0021FEA471|nr:uncharacterized protein EKO05_0000813 [Ascochyta rabiei]UPX10142.1 hypothetical protein EKO05_0000813 [Ascochyta rabiei]